MPEAIESLYPELCDTEREQIREAYVQQFLQADQKPSPFFDGVLEGLHCLRDQNYRLAIATGKSRRGLDRVLGELGLQHFFHASRCADETKSKPHPQMLNELLQEFSVNSDESIMIGDTEYDMAMAQAIKMPRIAVTYGAHSVERLMQYSPLLCADDFSKVVHWFDN